VAYVGVAVAGVPLILGLPWIVTRLVRPASPSEFGFAVFATATIVLIVLQSSIELTQPGRVHDRYLIYALPLLFSAMAAALLAPRRVVRGTVVTGVLFAVLVSRYDFVEAGADLPSLSFTLHKPINELAFSFGDRLGIADLSPGWFLAGLVLAMTALLAYVLREQAQRALLMTAIPVLLFCGLETADAFRQIHNSHYAFGFKEPRPRNWIDRALPPDTDVSVIVGQVGNPLTTAVAWWSAGYWNKSVQGYYAPPARRPEFWGQPSVEVLRLDADGVPIASNEWWLVTTGDPSVRVEGGRVVARAGQIELRQSSPDTPLRLLR
jgi:hypothetical protein